MDSNKKVALVTGGGRGLGRSISMELATSGVSVMLTYIHDKASALSTTKAILDTGGYASCIQMDVCNRKSVTKAVNRCVNHFGSLDILINNAGFNIPTDFDQINDDEWDKVLDINLKGPFICSQVAMPFLSRRPGSNILNIGSISGQYGGPRTAHYAASKAGLISLGQVIARFGARSGVRCNTIAAGLFESTMAKEGLESPIVKQASKDILLKRLGKPLELAKAVVFITSDDASYITGQTINVNGGLLF